jgi:hypothetical protein
MTVLSPPEPRQDELELLIREARAWQRKRWVGAASVVAVLAGSALGISSIVGGTAPSASPGGGRQRSVAASASRCGVQVQGVRILHGRRLVYREPVSRTFGHQIECSGSTVWVVFFNGVAASQQGYFGVRSGDSGRTWRLAFTERFFGMDAPHQLDDYLGPWTVTRHGAFFTGLCPACDPQPTISLWETKDGGRTFRRFDVAALDGYGPTAISVSGDRVTITGVRGNVPGPKHKTVTLHVA